MKPSWIRWRAGSSPPASSGPRAPPPRQARRAAAGPPEALLGARLHRGAGGVDEAGGGGAGGVDAVEELVHGLEAAVRQREEELRRVHAPRRHLGAHEVGELLPAAEKGLPVDGLEDPLGHDRVRRRLEQLQQQLDGGRADAHPEHVLHRVGAVVAQRPC